jgi:hypothetical protein
LSESVDLPCALLSTAITLKCLDNSGIWYKKFSIDPAGGPDVSPGDEFGCPTCRGYTWVFAFLLGRRNLCGILFCRGCDFEFSFHAIHTIGLKFTIDKHTAPMVPLRVLSRTNLARFALSTSSISFLSFRLRTLDLSLRSFCDSRLCFQQLPHSFCKTPGVAYPFGNSSVARRCKNASL